MRPVKQGKGVNVNKHRPQKRGNDNWLIKTVRLHKVSLVASLIRLLRDPFTSTISVVVMAIAIALAGSFYITVSNAQQLVNSLQAGKQISLFLQAEITDQQASQFAQELRTNDAIGKVTLISKQQAYAEFKQYSGFGAALDVLQGNPLPVVLLVYPKETFTAPYQLKQLAVQMQNQHAVDFTKIDMEWVARLQAIMEIANRVVVILSGLLAMAVVFITGNTIRSELQTRQDEVVLTKLVGGTDAFICLPFLYAGFWYGFISGLLAWCVISLMLVMLQQPIEQLSSLYQSQFQLGFLSFSESALLVLASSLFGVIGAFVVASHQLRLLEPE